VNAIFFSLIDSHLCAGQWLLVPHFPSNTFLHESLLRDECFEEMRGMIASSEKMIFLFFLSPHNRITEENIKKSWQRRRVQRKLINFNQEFLPPLS
jgi:hypothetical protein